MKVKTIKVLVLTVLLGSALALTGCASAPQEEPIQSERSERKKAPEGIVAPAPSRAPANESDDMERLD